MNDSQKKSVKIKELEIIRNELEDEVTHLNMKVKNLELIQGQPPKMQISLRQSYALQQMAASMASGEEDPFSAKQKLIYSITEEELRSDKPNVIERTSIEGESLAKQLGVDKEGCASPSVQTLFVKPLVKGANSENPDKIKVRESNLFAANAYFNAQNMKELESIAEEDKKEKISPQPVPVAEIKKEEIKVEPKRVEEQKKEEKVPQRAVEEKKEPKIPTPVVEVKKEPIQEENKKDPTKAIQEKFAMQMEMQKKKVMETLATTGLDMSRVSKITNFDFLAVKSTPKISKMLQTQKEAKSPLIFSDYIYMINEANLKKKSKRILYISQYSIYVLHHRTYIIQKIIPITDLHTLIVVKSSASLTAIHFGKK